MLQKSEKIREQRTGAFLSIGLMINFLSLKDMLRISLQGKPIFGVNLHMSETVISLVIRNLQQLPFYIKNSQTDPNQRHLLLNLSFKYLYSTRCDNVCHL